MNTVGSTHVPPAFDHASDVRRAWLCLLLVPVAFLAAFGVGEGRIALLGHPVGDSRPPVWAGLVATVPALVVFALPALLAAHFARRAARGATVAAGCPLAS